MSSICWENEGMQVPELWNLCGHGMLEFHFGNALISPRSLCWPKEKMGQRVGPNSSFCSLHWFPKLLHYLQNKTKSNQIKILTL